MLDHVVIYQNDCTNTILATFFQQKINHCPKNHGQENKTNNCNNNENIHKNQLITNSLKLITQQTIDLF